MEHGYETCLQDAQEPKVKGHKPAVSLVGNVKSGEKGSSDIQIAEQLAIQEPLLPVAERSERHAERTADPSVVSREEVAPFAGTQERATFPRTFSIALTERVACRRE